VFRVFRNVKQKLFGIRAVCFAQFPCVRSRLCEARAFMMFRSLCWYLKFFAFFAMVLTRTLKRLYSDKPWFALAVLWNWLKTPLRSVLGGEMLGSHATAVQRWCHVISGEPIISFGSGKTGLAVGRRVLAAKAACKTSWLRGHLFFLDSVVRLGFLHSLVDWVQKHS